MLYGVEIIIGETVEIYEVEEILGAYPFMPKPKHVIVVKEPVREWVDGYLYFRGLQPKFRSDVIVLTPQATDETVLHETLHALGLGEFGASLLGKLLIRKYEVLGKGLLGSLLFGEVKYVKCSGCEEFRVLHEKYAGRAEHYVRVE